VNAPDSGEHPVTITCPYSLHQYVHPVCITVESSRHAGTRPIAPEPVDDCPLCDALLVLSLHLVPPKAGRS
jgi:hypothetical protein